MNNPFKNHWPFWLSALLLAAITLSPLLGDHFFRNLEPYPDGLMYTIPPLEFLESGQWQLQYNGMSLKPNVPPLYSWLMLPIMATWRSPEAFILLNFLLVIGTTWFLYLALKPHSESNDKPSWQLAIILMFYSANVVVWWLAGLPMAENLGLFLISATIYLATNEGTNQNKKNPLFLSIVAIAFILTKYIYYPIGLVIAAGSLFYSLINKRNKEFVASMAILIFGLILATLVQINQGSGPLAEYLPFSQDLSTNINQLESTDQSFTFFSSQYIKDNLKFYFKSLIGFSYPLLWIRESLVPIFLIIFVLRGIFKLKHDYLPHFLLLILLWLSQFAMLLNFYVADQRYAILNIVFATFFAGYYFLTLKKDPNSELNSELKIDFMKIALGAVLIGMVFFQRYNLFPTIKANIFHRSDAWQHQAVLEFEKQNQLDQDSYLITALPPFLITAYSQPDYKILPLSKHQEFLAKGQNVWNPEITDSQNLLQTYQKWLDEGRNLYISNAYITHQKQVVNDFEEFKKHFNFETISEGCNQTCNVYKLGKQRILENQITFNFQDGTATFSKADISDQVAADQVTILTNYSNTDMFDSGLSSTKRYGSTHKISDQNPNDFALMVFDFDTAKFLDNEFKITELLKNILSDNGSRKISHYWSPKKNTLMILIQGMYDKGRLVELEVDNEAGAIKYVREYDFPTAAISHPWGWTNDGEYFVVESADEIENLPNTGAVRTVKSSLWLIDSEGNKIEAREGEWDYIRNGLYKN